MQVLFKNNQTFWLLPFIYAVKNFSFAIIGLLRINTNTAD
jgi:hypothetical protein